MRSRAARYFTCSTIGFARSPRRSCSRNMTDLTTTSSAVLRCARQGTEIAHTCTLCRSSYADCAGCIGASGEYPDRTRGSVSLNLQNSFGTCPGSGAAAVFEGRRADMPDLCSVLVLLSRSSTIPRNRQSYVETIYAPYPQSNRPEEAVT